MMIKAVVFDFDGLILETELPIFQTWQEIYQEYNCELPLDQWVACIGGTDEDFDVYAYLEARLGKQVERIAVQARCRQRQQELIARQEILPGVENYLSEARRLGLQVGLASNSSHQWVENHLKRLGIHDRFDCIKCGEDVLHSKPEPDLYLAAVNTLNVTADQAIAFEDSPNGVRAARSAGLFSVVVPGALTKDLPLDHADLRLESMASLPLSEIIDHAERKLKKGSSAFA